MENYSRTDLACETVRRGSGFSGGRSYREEVIGDCRIERMRLDGTEWGGESARPAGWYITLHTPPLWQLEGEERADAVTLLAAELRRLATLVCGREPDEALGVMVVGLGNADITADAVGPRTVRGLTATRHLADHDKNIFRLLGRCRLSAIAPGVLGQTGVEAADLVRGAADSVHPDLMVAIDALAARSVERLACTVQLSDTGICPGSGIGNRRRAIDRESMGCPVISLGIPTVVDSSTLVYDALCRAGIGREAVGAELREVLENGKRFYVSPKESDLIAARTAELLAEGIEEAFSLGGV